MPDEIKPASDVNIQTKTETTEVLDTNGKTISGASSPLADIFQKVEEGAKVKDAIGEVMKKPDAAPKKEAAAPVVPVVKEEKKEEKKEELFDKKEEVEDKGESPLDKKLSKDQREKAEKESGKTEAKKEEDDVSDDELKVLPHDKPKTAKRIQALLKKIDAVSATEATTKTELAARDAKLAELEKKLGEVKTLDPSTEEKIKKQQDELAMFRRRYDLDKDPELKTKYDDRIAAAETQIPKIFEKNGATKQLLELIAEEGGWTKFSTSQRLVKLADDSMITSAEFADKIVQSLPFQDRKAIDAITVEQIQLKREKDRFVEQEVKTANDYFKKRDEEASRQTEVQQKNIKDAEQVISNWQKEFGEKTPWMKPREIPANASAEDKAAIEEDNKFTAQLQGVVKKALNAKDLPSILEVIQESVSYHNERRENAKLLAKSQKLEAALKAKDEELTRIKNAGKTTSKAGSVSGGGTSAASAAPAKPRSLEEAFDAIASGSEA